MNDFINDELIQNTYLFCVKRVSDSEAAKDLSQDILCSALAALRDGRKITNFYSWYWQMARNKLADSITHKQNPALPIEIAGGMISDTMQPVDRLIRKEDIAELNFALSRLACIHREIIIHYYLKEHSVAQIAKELNIPEGTVKRRLFDAKKKLKERFDTMNNTGKSSYAPAEIQYFWGYNMREPDKVLRSKIAQQIMVVCAMEAKTVNEIADEMGVAPVYLQEILDSMVKVSLLVQPAKDKYIANHCVLPMQSCCNADYAAYSAYLDNNIPEKICRAVFSAKEEIMAKDFYGKELGFPYLCWEFLINASRITGFLAREIYCQKYEQKYPDESDRKYRLGFRYLAPDETVDAPTYEGTRKTIPWSNLSQNFSTSKYGEILFVNDFEAEPFPNDGDEIERGRDKWIDGNNIELLIDLSREPDKELSPYEQEKAACFIEHGLLTKTPEGLTVMLPIFTKAASNEINSILKKVLRPVSEEIVGLIGKKTEDILLPYVRPDLFSNFIHWEMHMFFQPIGVVMYHALYETDYLSKPDDYSRSAAGLFIEIP